MTNYSVADAKNKLSELIERARGGEPVVITRHGEPVAELKPLPKVGRRITLEDVEWLRSRRAGRASAVDAGALVTQMRDEDWR